MRFEGKHHSEETKQKIREANTREKSSSWKGGFKNGNGYISFKVPEGCRFSCMKDSQGYVMISRLTMAAHLGRPLIDEEIVHHINGIKDDNRIENLGLFKDDNEHKAYHYGLRKINEWGRLVCA